MSPEIAIGLAVCFATAWLIVREAGDDRPAPPHAAPVGSIETVQTVETVEPPRAAPVGTDGTVEPQDVPGTDQSPPQQGATVPTAPPAALPAVAPAIHADPPPVTSDAPAVSEAAAPSEPPEAAPPAPPAPPASAPGPDPTHGTIVASGPVLTRIPDPDYEIVELPIGPTPVRIGTPIRRPDPDRLVQTVVIEPDGPAERILALLRLVAAITTVGLVFGFGVVYLPKIIAWLIGAG